MAATRANDMMPPLASAPRGMVPVLVAPGESASSVEAAPLRKVERVAGLPIGDCPPVSQGLRPDRPASAMAFGNRPSSVSATVD